MRLCGPNVLRMFGQLITGNGEHLSNFIYYISIMPFPVQALLYYGCY